MSVEARNYPPYLDLFRAQHLRTIDPVKQNQKKKDERWGLNAVSVDLMNYGIC